MCKEKLEANRMKYSRTSMENMGKTIYIWETKQALSLNRKEEEENEKTFL